MRRPLVTILGLARLARLAPALVFFVAGSTGAEVRPSSDDYELQCGAPPPGHAFKGRRDYRLMRSNAKDLIDLENHGRFHIDTAIKQLRSGANINSGVMNNLHFVLHKVPNDQRALSVLIEWDAAGGRDKDYASPACYFTWARQFAPDDPSVWIYGGYYFYRHRDLAQAQRWWERAVALDPSNAEAHYNLGLLLADTGQYDAARTHAWAAYQAGYPLPGLRNKLQVAGQWRDPPATLQ